MTATPVHAGAGVDSVRSRRPRPQRLPKVSSPQDASEIEAERAASRIVAGGSAGTITPLGHGGAGRAVRDDGDTLQAWLQRVGEDDERLQRVAVGEDDERLQRVAVGEDDERLQRVAVGEDDERLQRVAVGEDDERLQREPDGAGAGSTGGVAGGSGATLRTIANPAPGAPLAPAVRGRVEPGLGASLDAVRVHTDAASASAAGVLQARAFTYRNDIFLGRGGSPTDLALMAHESVHVVQQGAAGGEPQVQRLVGWIRDELADLAGEIPGYQLFTVIIGYDPIRGSAVERNGRNLLEGLMKLVPFGGFIFDALDDLGLIDALLRFIDDKLTEHDLSLARLERTIERAWDRMGILEDNFEILLDEFGELWNDVKAFAADLVQGLVEKITDAAIDLVASLVDDQPVWRLFTKVIGRDPLRDEPVEASTEEIIADFLILIGRETELEQMRERGTLAETAEWIDTQLVTFYGLVDRVGGLLSAAWDAIQPSNLGNIIGDLEALAVDAVELLGDIGQFAWTVAAKVLELVKKALLGWLSSFVHEVPGFHLVTVIIGRNPFTGDRVPRTAENLIRGFITLIPGGNAVYERLVETGVVPQAAAAIEGAVAELGISWEMVTGLFLGIWDSLTIDDLIDPVGAFTRIRDQFGEPIARLFAFIRVVLEQMLNLLLAIMHFPVDLIGSIVSNAMAAFSDIRQDFIGFLLNMLGAVKAGFSAFFGNIATHLLGGVTDWLFRGLRDAGIEPPTDLSFSAILDVVLQLLGLTVENLWTKLADRIGQERVDQIRGVIDRLSGIWAFVTDVQERGITAVWEYVQGQLAGLWDMVLAKARDWIVEVIVTRVTARLLTMLDPTGIMAVINGFVAFFDAVQSAIEYFTDILQIVDQWVTTIGAIARGEVQAGAVILEGALADAIPVAIGFLAQQVGLTNIGERLGEIVEAVRGLVDRALNWLLDQAMAVFNSVLSALGFGGEDDEEAPIAPDVELTPEAREALYDDVGAALEGGPDSVDDVVGARAFLADVLAEFRPQGLRGLTVTIPDDAQPWNFEVTAYASPGKRIGWIAVSDKMNIGDLRFRRSTTLHAILNGQNIGVYRAAGKDYTADEDDHSQHAEQLLLTDLTLPVVHRHFEPGEPNELLVRITRSPCPRCTRRIMNRLESLRGVGVVISMRIEMASVLGGQQGERDFFVSLRKLQRLGVRFAPLDILAALDDLGFSPEQQAKIRDRPELMQLLTRRVAQVRDALERAEGMTIGEAFAG